jgi:nickel-dependent lactate racemase
LTSGQVAELVAQACPAKDYRGKRVLLIVPDGTRTAPVGLLFKALHEQIAEAAKAFDVLVALGTHQPMSERAICQRLEIAETERTERYRHVCFFNHAWNEPRALKKIGAIPAAEIAELSGGLFSMDVPVEVNRLVFDYDQIILVGPVFPHEVVGFSGGNKYLFPGVSGPEILNFFHWLGAVVTNPKIIGNKWTPVRKVVDRAASLVNAPKLCFCMVVAPSQEPGGYGWASQASPSVSPERLFTSRSADHSVPDLTQQSENSSQAGNGARPDQFKGQASQPLVGLFAGSPESAWDAASELSRQVHLVFKEKPFHTILSCSPTMYDELWTGGKCMYKLEPVLADGGELIIYAPHISEVCVAHGKALREVGYHCRDYFLKQWDKFKHYPWGVLAHATHVYGQGTYEDGVETPRARVTLATAIPPDVCQRINLGYRDPKTVRVEDFANRVHEGILHVPKAGEMLYRLKTPPAWAE